MAPQEQLERFSDDGDGGNDNDDEAPSLCDLPIKNHDGQEKECKLSEALEDFEFRTAGCGLSLHASSAVDMCPADNIFYQGQLLPLGASLSSRTCDRSLSINSRSSSNYSSSNCSSTSVSRSHSSSSHSSNLDMPRLSVSNKFYAHPSPSPQIRTNNSNPGRKSTGSAPPAGWGFFRLGVARAPEIELNNLRLRRLRSNDSKCGSNSVKKSVSKFRFGCKCAANVSEPVRINSSRPLIPNKDGLERKESISKRSRMFEWLEELSIV